ncbi:MAG: SIMPL domain-containing protein [Thermoproteota archaeon]|nr:SIMPL domain-containing protein [Thermoproteota archaeon]
MTTTTKHSPRDTSRTKTKGLGFFFACLLALALFMATPLAGTLIPAAQAQTTGETSPEVQEPTTNGSINATQTVTQANETNLADDDDFDEQNDYSPANLSTLSVSSTSTTEVRPDQLSVTLGGETNATTAQEAVSQNANLTAQVIGAIRGLGIDENRIETSSYSVLPIYEYIQPSQPCIEIYPPPPGCETRQEIIGYRATNTVTVTLDVPFFRVATQSVPDVNAGQVIDAAVGAGANRVDGVIFFISPDRQQEIRDTLIGDAIANARQRANIAAEALQMTVSGVESMTINPIDFPVFSLQEGSIGAADTVSAPTQILPAQQEVSTTVSVVFYISTEGSIDG